MQKSIKKRLMKSNDSVCCAEGSELVESENIYPTDSLAPHLAETALAMLKGSLIANVAKCALRS